MRSAFYFQFCRAAFHPRHTKVYTFSRRLFMSWLMIAIGSGYLFRNVRVLFNTPKSTTSVCFTRVLITREPTVRLYNPIYLNENRYLRKKHYCDNTAPPSDTNAVKSVAPNQNVYALCTSSSTDLRAGQSAFSVPFCVQVS